MINSEEKYNKLLKLFEANNNARLNITIHKEIAAWTYAGLYFTFIIGLYNIFSNNKDIIVKNFECYLIVVFILILLLLILILIHAQYGRHQADRAMNDTCNYFIYKILSGEIDIKENEWEIPNNKTLPEFLTKKINSYSSKYHRIYKIFPGISLLWFGYKILVNTCFLIKSSICAIFKFSNTKEWKWKYSPKKFFVEDKINLIESTLYSILILHTITFLIWVSKLYK